ncbi:MAG TPA: hypothetical protein VF355_06735 [Anaerolineaceae bacterium]
MNKLISALICLALALAVIPAARGTAAAPLSGAAAPGGFVTTHADRLTLDGAPFVMKGANYFPRDFAWTSLADWDWNEVDQELALAESLHANTIRIAINYPYSTGNAGGDKNILTTHTVLPKYVQALDRLLTLADNHHLKVVFALNDGLWPELWDPKNFAVEQAYLAGLIPHYAGDPRIAAWDLAPDIDASMLLPAPAGAFGTVAWSTRDNLVTFVQSAAAAVRKLDPNHLLAAGVAWPSTAVLLQDFTDIIFPQFLGEDHPELLTKPAVGSAQDYGQWDTILQQPAVVLSSLEATVKSIQSQLKRPMPVVLSEFGLSTYPPAGTDPSRQQAVYEVVSQLVFTRLHLAGALSWTLTDFTWPPRANSNRSVDNSPGNAASLNFGLFGADYIAKPAVDVVRRYFNEVQEITLQPFQDQLSADGNSVQVSGSFAVPISDGKVTVQVGSTLGVWSDAGSMAPVNGLFSIPIQLRRGYSVFVRAIWDGDGIYLPITSSPLTFNLSMVKSSLALTALPAVVIQSTDISISGKIVPALAGLNLSLTFTSPAGVAQVQAVRTGSSGVFDTTFTPAQAGRWTLSIRWEGDADYTTLEQSVSFNVTLVSLDCSLSSTDVSPGDQVDLAGYLTPGLSDVPISLVLNLPDGSSEDELLQTAPDGSFSYSILPQVVGKWGLNASTPGSSPQQASTCNALSFTVQNSLLPLLYVGLVLIGIVLLGTLAGTIMALRRKKTGLN